MEVYNAWADQVKIVSLTFSLAFVHMDNLSFFRLMPTDAGLGCCNSAG
eukprot:SAG31_NODE_670_length_12943_cov_18.029508_7_plen_48_part_00